MYLGYKSQSKFAIAIFPIISVFCQQTSHFHCNCTCPIPPPGARNITIANKILGVTNLSRAQVNNKTETSWWAKIAVTSDPSDTVSSYTCVHTLSLFAG